MVIMLPAIIASAIIHNFHSVSLLRQICLWTTFTTLNSSLFSTNPVFLQYIEWTTMNHRRWLHCAHRQIYRNVFCIFVSSLNWLLVEIIMYERLLNKVIIAIIEHYPVVTNIIFSLRNVFYKYVESFVFLNKTDFTEWHQQSKTTKTNQ